jgi:glycosyltransferase involved in cell wall biosynthesis
MVEGNLRVAGVLVGDLHSSASTRIKYGLLFEAVARQYKLLGVYDASLHGLARLVNALEAFHPNRQVWRERFRKNVPAFRRRSRQVAARLRALHGQADVVLQVGVLFDARWEAQALPSVIYTDYTAQLSAQALTRQRSPFTLAQRRQWMALERHAYERAAHVCTRGRHVRDSIVEDYRIPLEKVTAIGGGVNFAVLPERPERPPHSPPTVLFIGQEFHRKGGDLLLRAFAQARRQVPEARLIVITSDPIPAGLPLDGVEVKPPVWDRTAIASLYRQADLFVLPSRLETWGDVLLEAMAYYLPCVGVRGQAMEEIITDGTTGLLVAPDDVGALAAALGRLLTDATLRQRLGEAGRQKLEAEFTWDHVVERLAPRLALACRN